MQTIYVDVLIILNVYVNFILILATAKITRSKVLRVRGIVSAVYGSFYSLLILAPEIDGWVNLLIKLFAGVTIVIIAFGCDGFARTLINTACFFTANVIFGGTVFAVYVWLQPSFMHFNNTYFYIDFSLLVLIFVTAFLYTAISIFRFFTDRYSAVSKAYRIIVKYHGSTAVLDALADTGNSLVDFFSGKPVIICSRSELADSFDLPDGDCPEDMLKKGFRLIPYSTIGNCGMMPVFTPDEVFIVSGETNYRKRTDALIGIKSNEKRAIFNPNLLKN